MIDQAHNDTGDNGVHVDEESTVDELQTWGGVTSMTRSTIDETSDWYCGSYTLMVLQIALPSLVTCLRLTSLGPLFTRTTLLPDNASNQ